LKAGSVIAVPERFVVRSAGRINLRETILNWATKTHSGRPGPKSFAFGDGHKETFYPVQVVHPAEGSRLGASEAGETKWVALGSLYRTKNLDIVPTPSPSASNPKKSAGNVILSKPYKSYRMETTTPCVNCGTAVPGPRTEHARVTGLAEIAARTTSASSGPLRESTRILPASRRRAASCSNIIDDEGGIGPWGKDIARIMLEDGYLQNFYADNALGDLCPQFANLTPKMKNKAWLWFWAALAQEESGCNPKKDHPKMYIDKKTGRRVTLNPHYGWGLWAMEKDRNIRADRGSSCYDISSVSGQARCSVDIMNRRQLSKGRTASNDSKTYWGPINRRQKQLMPHMKRFQACF